MSPVDRALLDASMELAKLLIQRKRNKPVTAEQSAIISLYERVLQLEKEQRSLVAMLATFPESDKPADVPPVDEWKWCDDCEFSHPEGLHG